MTDHDIDIPQIAQLHARLREQKPLVQNITNYVAMTISANALLAVGASPAMVHASEEVEDFVTISSALVINVGTLSPSWVVGMRAAAKRAQVLGKPWVLDPVGCGATPYRTAVTTELAQARPTIIRGNASEIMSLVGQTGAGGKGVDSTASSEAAISAAVALARNTGAVVAVTGALDYVTDGKRAVTIDSSDVLLTLSTGLGCALSAVTAAFSAVAPPLLAASAALAVYGAAGRQAAHTSQGPGHLPAHLCDALYNLDQAALAKHAHIKVAVVS